VFEHDSRWVAFLGKANKAGRRGDQRMIFLFEEKSERLPASYEFLLLREMWPITRRVRGRYSLLLRALVVASGPVFRVHAAVLCAIVRDVLHQKIEPAVGVLVGEDDELRFVRLESPLFPKALKSERDEVRVVVRELETLD